MSNNNLRFIPCLIVTTILLAKDGLCIRLDKVSVPRYKFSGEDVELGCDFSLGNDTLYAVKWYYDESEFYRYLPENSPPKVVFNMTGVTVNVSKSDLKKVYLEKVNNDSSGVYRCEVSAEAPTFATVSGEGKLEVISLTDGGPFISGEAGTYKMGDDLYINCSTTPTYPQSKLIWYVNDYTVNYLSIERNRTLYIDPKTNFLYWWSRIRIPLTPEIFSKGSEILVRCISELSPKPWKGNEKDLPILDIKEAKILVIRSCTGNGDVITLSCPTKERSNQTTDQTSEPEPEPETTTTEALPIEDSIKSNITCEGHKYIIRIN